MFLYREKLKKKKKRLVLVWVFLSLLKLFENSMSVSVINRTSIAIERIFAFHCTVCVHVLYRLHVCTSAYQTRPTLECSLWTLECSALVRLIAPLLQSSTLASYYTFPRLHSIAWYLRSSASPWLAPTDQK